MKKRLLTSGAILLILAAAFASRLLTLYVFDLVVLIMAVIGVVEIARVLERTKKYTHILIVGTFPAVLYILSIILIKKNLNWQYLVMGIFLAMIAYFLLIFIVTLCTKKVTRAEMEKYEITDQKVTKYAFEKAIYSLGVFVYPALLFECLILINHFSELAFVVTPDNRFTVFTTFVLLFVFVVTMCTDSLAMVVGSTLKGPKLCPLISPNKTVSGAIGGLIGGTGSGLLLYLIFTAVPEFVSDFTTIGGKFWEIAVISFLGAIVGQIGDLVASALKRRARVKDYGTVLPGHGGIMDRVDGLIFNALLCFVAFTLVVVLK